MKNTEQNKKVALITGVTGQDGSYLSELLLSKGYEVHGIIRRSSSFNTGRIDHIRAESEDQRNKLMLHYGDLMDSSSLNRLLEQINPSEIYNLGAQSHVHISFQTPEYTSDVNALGTLRILDSIKNVGIKPRFYQASSSELFGKVMETPQTEKTPFYPRSPYASAKLFAYWTTINYREAYGLYACNGILFNHESPRRGETFVTRKVTRGVAQIACGLLDKISIGNLEARRDWGYAKEYVEPMWLMLQQDQPDDYVIATGESHSVRDLCIEVFKHIGKELRWEGQGVDEKGYDSKTGDLLIDVNPKYFRPTEVDYLIGDASKAKEKLGWSTKTSFRELIQLMVEADLQDIKGLVSCTAPVKNVEFATIRI